MDEWEPGMEKLGNSAPLEEPARAEAPRLLIPDRKPAFQEWQVAQVAGRGRARWVGPPRLLFSPHKEVTES